jgi:hypothetical protein
VKLRPVVYFHKGEDVYGVFIDFDAVVAVLYNDVHVYNVILTNELTNEVLSADIKVYYNKPVDWQLSNFGAYEIERVLAGKVDVPEFDKYLHLAYDKYLRELMLDPEVI